MATKNNGLEKRTKAELIELVQRLTHSCNELEMQKERVKEEYNAVAVERGELQEKVNRVAESRDAFMRESNSARTKLMDLERTHNVTRAELEEMTTDRDSWKQAFREEQAGKRKARELLIRQAHLAGELAQLTGHVALKNA